MCYISLSLSTYTYTYVCIYTYTITYYDSSVRQVAPPPSAAAAGPPSATPGRRPIMILKIEKLVAYQTNNIETHIRFCI